MTERVFFITRQHLKVFMWKKNTLKYEYDFLKNEQGFDAFSAYLSTIKKQPIRILLDIFEEEYQYETIPFTRGADRKALINRLLDRFYRDNIFKHVHITGRKNEGRKDLEILLTSISNTESINKWIELINEQGTPIMGVWSTPLIAEDLVKTIFKTEQILLIFRSMRSALRESYYYKKKLFVSRQERIKKDITQKNDANSYVTNNIANIKRFLANQRIIGFNEKMTIGCILPENIIKEAQIHYPNTDQLSYQFESLENVAKTYKIEYKESIKADTILSYICSYKRPSTNHYPDAYKKNTYTEYKINKIISTIGIWGVIFLLFLSTVFFIQGVDNKNALEVNNTKLQYIEKNYLDRFDSISDRLNSAENINDHIQFINQLKLETSSSPERYFSYIGNTLSKNEFSAITLKELTWKKLKPSEIDVIRSKHLTAEHSNDIPYNDETNQSSGLTPSFTLIGKVKINQHSYRENINIINSFVTDLNKNPEIKHIIPIKLPIDPRDSTIFSDSYKLNKEDKIIEEDTSKFEILILLEPTKVLNSAYIQGY